MAAPSLAGYVVGVTADRRADEQIELLRRRGATTLHGPSIKTLPLDAAQELRSITELLLRNPPDYVIANTGIGMRGWFAAADGWGIGDELTDALSLSRIFARGPKAAAAAHRPGSKLRAERPRSGSTQSETVARGAFAGTRIAYKSTRTTGGALRAQRRRCRSHPRAHYVYRHLRCRPHCASSSPSPSTTPACRYLTARPRSAAVFALAALHGSTPRL